MSPVGFVLRAEWRRWRAGMAWRAPRGMRRWLADQGSLTRRVQWRCRSVFKVRLIRQAWERPTASEAVLLGARGWMLCREVVLCCGDEPWVFARTLIPRASLRGGARCLRLLGERPLGEVLFSDPATRRQRVEVARLAVDDPLWRRATAACGLRGDDLWGRRTLFRYAGKPLLVNEIFLPVVDSR